MKKLIAPATLWTVAICSVLVILGAIGVVDVARMGWVFVGLGAVAFVGCGAVAAAIHDETDYKGKAVMPPWWYAIGAYGLAVAAIGAILLAGCAVLS